MNNSLSGFQPRRRNPIQRFASADAAARRLANDEAIGALVRFMSAPASP